MIRFVVPSGGTKIDYLKEFWDNYAPDLDVAIYDFPELVTGLRAEQASTIFAGLDLTSESDHKIAEGFADDHRVFNQPKRVLGRYDLLRKLHAMDRNSFRVFPIDGERPSCRYPAFIRSRVTHDGPWTHLLPDWEALDFACAGLNTIKDLSRAMIVEFCDTRNSDGLYRKYSVQRIGNKYIQRHMLVSADWVTKTQEIVTSELVDEELAFLHGPVCPDVIYAFELAGIDYGRMDYGIDKNGQIQIWEINMNPTLAAAPERLHPLRREGQRWSADRIVEAFLAL